MNEKGIKWAQVRKAMGMIANTISGLLTKQEASRTYATKAEQERVDTKTLHVVGSTLVFTSSSDAEPEPDDGNS